MQDNYLIWNDSAPQRMYLLLKIYKDRKVWPGEGKIPAGGPIIADYGSGRIYR